MSVVTPSVVGMRDLGLDTGVGSATAAPAGVGKLAFARAIALPRLDEVRVLTRRLAGSGQALDDAARIDMLRALEELKCAAEAAQAEVTADFDRSQRAAAAARGEPAERQGGGIAHQVALAR